MPVKQDSAAVSRGPSVEYCHSSVAEQELRALPPHTSSDIGSSAV